MNLKKKCLSLIVATALNAGMPRISESYTPLPGRTIDSYAAIKKKMDRPDKVWAYFNSSAITYRKDQEGIFVGYDNTLRIVGKDYMQDPIDTYLSGEGDCEDYAALAADWLSAAGLPSKIIGFFERGNKNGHHICAVQYHGVWFYLGNEDYNGPYPSIQALIEKNEPNWAVYYEATLDQTKGAGERVFNEIYRNDAAKRKFGKCIERLK
ncbi:MAG: hypothetical protein AABX47_03770 [Nanoarchaeota archaeon]